MCRNRLFFVEILIVGGRLSQVHDNAAHRVTIHLYHREINSDQSVPLYHENTELKVADLTVFDLLMLNTFFVFVAFVVSRGSPAAVRQIFNLLLILTTALQNITQQTAENSRRTATAAEVI